MTYSELSDFCYDNGIEIKSLCQRIGVTPQGLAKGMKKQSLGMLTVKSLCDEIKITPNRFFGCEDYSAQFNTTQVGVMNRVMGEDIDLVSYEIMNCVNSISNAINELIEELGENNVFIDELLIGYFIQKFNVPAKYVDKVYRILENSYAIENKCLRDGIKLNGTKIKKKDMETDGGKEILKHRKHGDIDNIMIDKALAELIMKDIDEEDIGIILG